MEEILSDARACSTMESRLRDLPIDIKASIFSVRVCAKISLMIEGKILDSRSFKSIF